MYPGAPPRSRARSATKLAEICPGDIDKFFFTLGGAEANENAIKLARLFTGRHKILVALPQLPRRDRRGAMHADRRLRGAGPTSRASSGVVRVIPDLPHSLRRDEGAAITPREPPATSRR